MKGVGDMKYRIKISMEINGEVEHKKHKKALRDCIKANKPQIGVWAGDYSWEVIPSSFKITSFKEQGNA